MRSQITFFFIFCLIFSRSILAQPFAPEPPKEPSATTVSRVYHKILNYFFLPLNEQKLWEKTSSHLEEHFQLPPHSLNKELNLVVQIHQKHPHLEVSQIRHQILQSLVEATQDPYSQWLSPSQSEQFLPQGFYFEGYGVSLKELPSKETFLIADLLPESSASEAGIQKGDLLVGIDNHSLKGYSISKIYEHFAQNKSCTWLLQREHQTFEVHLQHKKVAYQPLRYQQLNPNTHYLKIQEFTPGYRQEWKKYLSKVSVPNSKLILDLRDNPGGNLNEALYYLSFFFEERSHLGASIYHNKKRTLYRSKKNTSTPYEGELFVLVNRETASSAEFFIQALKSHERAQILGEKSYGKGTLQLVFPYPENYTLVLSVAQLFGPHHKSWHETGIAPDLTLSPETSVFKDPLKDPWIQKVLQLSTRQTDPLRKRSPL